MSDGEQPERLARIEAKLEHLQELLVSRIESNDAALRQLIAFFDDQLKEHRRHTTEIEVQHEQAWKAAHKRLDRMETEVTEEKARRRMIAAAAAVLWPLLTGLAVGYYT